MPRSVIFVFFIISGMIMRGQSMTDSLMQEFRNNKNDSLRIDAGLKLHNLLADQYPDSTYIILQEALDLAKKNDDYQRMVKVLTLQGQVFDRLNNYLEAQRTFFQAEKLLDSIRGEIPDTSFDKSKMGLVNSRAIVYLHTGKYDEAMDSYLQMIEFLENKPDSSSFHARKDLLMIAYHNLGSAYLSVMDYDQAEYYFLKAISYMKSDDNKGMATIFNNLGIIEKDRGHNDKSLDYLSRAIEIRRKSGNMEGLVQSLNNLGNLFMRTGKTRKALDTLQLALALAKENKYLRSETITLELLSSVYADLGDYKNAYLTHREYKQQYDSLKKQEDLRNITQLEMQQRFESRLKEENLLRQKEDLKRQKKEAIYLFIMIGSLMLFSIIVMLYALQRSKLKRHQLIADKESLLRRGLELENEKLNLDLEFKNKELTTNVIYLARTNEFISDLSQKLMKSRLNFSKENQKLIDELVKDISHFSDRDTWKEFELRFQEVHSDFYKKLLESFPDLSSNEKKLCAFLRLNMTTKEISAITYQSVNSITVARSRLRKKLGIDQDENLVAFLEKL